MSMRAMPRALRAEKSRHGKHDRCRAWWKKHNAAREAALERDYDHLGERLDRRGIAIDDDPRQGRALSASPSPPGASAPAARASPAFPARASRATSSTSWRIARSSSNSTRATPTVSLHIPWDKADPQRLKQTAARFGLRFDAMNSNTFQDHPGQEHSYKFGSLSHTDAGTRRQAIEHNLECIEIGRTHRLEGADGVDRRRLELSRPGRISPKASSAISTSMQEIYAALPEDWRLFTEHKMYEPAFYSTVVQDWGTNYIIAQELGPEGLLPCRSRPSRAERQYRDDRLAADPVRQAGRLPFQRFQIWRRRSR